MKVSIDIEYLLPILDLWMSLVIRKISGLHQIDLEAYREQSAIYLKSSNPDYSKLIGDTGPIQYPALSLYLYSFFNIINPDFSTEFMSNVHIVVDLIRMWLLVKIYKVAYRHTKKVVSARKMYIFVLLLL